MYGQPKFEMGQHIMMHFALYARLAMMMVSFFFLRFNQVLFLAFCFVPMFVGYFDKLVSSAGPKQQEVTKMLHKIMEKIGSY